MQTVIGQEFPTKVIPLIDGAKSNIRIVVFDWRWYANDPGSSVQLFNQAIIRAARRNVQVKAICNFESVVSALIACGCVARKLTTKNLVHVKLIIIDDKIVVIGSHNFTQNAFTTNHEASVIFEDTENSQILIKFFDELWLL